MLEEFNDLISTLCANSPITQEEHRDRLFFTNDGLIFDSFWESNDYFKFGRSERPVVRWRLLVDAQPNHRTVSAGCRSRKLHSSPQLMGSNSTTIAARHSRKRLVTHTCTRHDSN